MPTAMQIELGFPGDQRVNAAVTNRQRKDPTMTTTNHTPIRARFARKPYSLDEVLHNALKILERNHNVQITDPEFEVW